MPVRYRMSEAYRLHGLRSDIVGRLKVRRFIVKHVCVVGLKPFCDALFVRPSAVSSAHLLRSLPFRPTLALSVPNSLSGSGTHLALLRGRRCSRRLGSIIGKKGTGFFELSNFGVNRGENLIYRHLESISNLILRAPCSSRVHSSDSPLLSPKNLRRG